MVVVLLKVSISDEAYGKLSRGSEAKSSDRLLFFLHFPFYSNFLLTDLSCLSFPHRLGLGNQVGSTTDHLLLLQDRLLMAFMNKSSTPNK